MTAFKYYLGLDMGTNSVGWAATDPEYRLLKAKGKDLWGSEACIRIPGFLSGSR